MIRILTDFSLDRLSSDSRGMRETYAAVGAILVEMRDLLVRGFFGGGFGTEKYEPFTEKLLNEMLDGQLHKLAWGERHIWGDSLSNPVFLQGLRDRIEIERAL